MRYPELDQQALAFIRSQLQKAGASEEALIYGPLWISSALAGIAQPKTPSDDRDSLQKLRDQLEKAQSTAGKLSNTERQWLSDDVLKPIERASAALSFRMQVSPGGQREQSHRALVEAIERFFESESLPIADSEGSPFMAILSHCMGRADNTASTRKTYRDIKSLK